MNRVVVFALALCAGAARAMPETVSIPSQDAELSIPGYWFQAPDPGPRPAIISLHGCGGMFDARGRLGPVYARDAGYLHREGMHLLAIDSFTPRGRKSICEIPHRQRNLSPEDRRRDVYASIAWLAKHPAVDAARIVVMGRSHGGSTALLVMDRTSSAVSSQPLRPRAAIALYPGCGDAARLRRYEIAAPLLVLAGEADDWTSAWRCFDLRDKLRREQPGAPFELVVYPDAHHGFDGTAALRRVKNVQTRSGEATVGGHPQARAQAYRRLFDFLSEQLDAPLRVSHDERLRAQPRGTRPSR